MKDDLKRLMNEFLSETREERVEKINTRFTKDMPESFEHIVREPTLSDLIDWLND